MKINCLGICGGNGVILHPFRDRLIGNIEPRTVFHTPEQVQWYLNFESPYYKDYFECYPNVIIGAPDCGHSSVLAYSRAKKLSNPEDNTSLQLYINGVLHYKPLFFLMENLPKLIDNVGTDLDKVFKDYRLIKFIEGVDKWGNSQITRVRLVIIGIHKTIPRSIDKYVTLPVYNKDLPTEGELLKGLTNTTSDNICHVREHDTDMVHLWYQGESKITVAKARELWLSEYKNLKKWPVNNGNLKNQPGVYRNFADDYPLTVRKQNRQFNHDGYMMSPREMAIIQGVPMNFKIWYDENQHHYCINKGRTTVTKSPPYEVGLWFKKVLHYITNKI